MKNGLVSIPIKGPTAFQLENVKSENIKVSMDIPQLDSKWGLRLELLNVGGYFESRHGELAVKIVN